MKHLTWITLAITLNTFSQAPGNGVTDIDGNNYPVVKIGNQIWMKENLRVSRYRNGDPIPIVTDNTAWSGLTTGARSWYNNDSTSFEIPYGNLYNWYAASDNRNICPTGWHVPTDPEWTSLEEQLGGSAGAGGKMKQQGDVSTSPPGLWNSPNTGADNLSGFTALPGGFRNFRGSVSINLNTFFWSNTSSLSDAISR